MKNIKKLISFALLIGVVTIASACSNNEQEESQNSESAQTDTEVQSEEPTEESSDGTEHTSDSRILITYFSLSDNAEYPEDIDATTSASIVADDSGRYGTTEYVARMIQAEVGGDIHSIQTEEPYSTDFDTVTEQNHEEIDAESMPALKSSDLDMEQYDVVFIGYPVWATTVPRPIYSFIEEYNLQGKTVIPFCTHDGYGAGGSYSDIENACTDIEMLQGLAIEAVDVPQASGTVSDWIAGLNLTAASPETDETGETPISITIGEQTLEGVLYDSEEAQQFLTMLPQTVSMSGYGGREYYGGLDGDIQEQQEGQLHFEDGDITYCPQNNTIAIFYAQTDNPDLTMRVIPIGKVTSDLSVFDTLGSREEISFTVK